MMDLLVVLTLVLVMILLGEKATGWGRTIRRWVSAGRANNDPTLPIGAAALRAELAVQLSDYKSTVFGTFQGLREEMAKLSGRNESLREAIIQLTAVETARRELDVELHREIRDLVVAVRARAPDPEPVEGGTLP